VAGATLMALAWAAAGCSSGEEKASGAELWKAEFAAAVEQATSDWEREMLERAAESGQLTDGDFAYAEQMFLQCMADRGVPAEKETDPDTGYFGYSFDDPDGLDALAIQKECSQGNGLVVRALYTSQRGNPDFEDVNELMAECLVREGLVAEGYSGDDYERDMTANDPSFDQSSDDLMRCQVNPVGS
jgi:hypothetical protein